MSMDTPQETYMASIGGLDDWPARPIRVPTCQAFPAPSGNGQREPDETSGSRLGPPETGNGPTQPKGRKSRFSARQRRVRRLLLREYLTVHYTARKALSDATRNLLDDLQGHVSRCRGEVMVKEFNDDLLNDLADYFVRLAADGDAGPATANKHLRMLRAVCRHAAKRGFLPRSIEWDDFFQEPEPDPRPFTEEECEKIYAAARAVTGLVGVVPAAIFWSAYARVAIELGPRISATLLASRGDYCHGVLTLRAENQKQRKTQRLGLTPEGRAAIEDLLAAHDQERLFPWPFDQQRPGKKTNWKTFYKHYDRKLLAPCGIVLPKGVKTRACRQTAATTIHDGGGSAQRQCGHSTPRIAEKHYIPKDHVPVIREAVIVARRKARRAMRRAKGQRELFQTEDPK